MFKTLSSETRRKILGILAKREMHLSGLAREIGISVTATIKHCKLLEEKGLIKKRNFGNSHVLKANLDKLRIDNLYNSLDIFNEPHQVDVKKGSNLLDALKKVSGVKIKKVGDREFITSVDGEEGYYIFEVDGKMPNISIDKFIVDKNVEIELKKLAPIRRKTMNLEITEN
jgi:DNA-binding transcriptional ArsR family regulator|tara:strand:+ start:953 stop:1465 length:513 start_codon:yes stop_codon:yes gene_type:complete